MSPQHAEDMAAAISSFLSDQPGRGWIGKDFFLYSQIQEYIDPECPDGVWKSDRDRFCAYLGACELLSAASLRGVAIWRGTNDRLIRVVDTHVPSEKYGQLAYEFITRPRKQGTVCHFCELEEMNAEELEFSRLMGNQVFLHPACKFAWMGWNRVANDYQRQLKAEECTQ